MAFCILHFAFCIFHSPIFLLVEHHPNLWHFEKRSTTNETMSAEECAATMMAHVEALSSNPIFVGVVVFTALYLFVEKYALLYHTKLWIEYLTSSVPTIDVEMTPAEAKDDGVKGEPVSDMQLLNAQDNSKLNCFDPSTKQLIGHSKNMNAKDVNEILVKAKAAQKEWAKTTFAQRRMVLRTIQKYIVAHVEDICRVSARESGKPKVDAVMGEILTTCEKIRTICEWGEYWLRPDYRPTGPMMMHKSAWVEYVPLGVIVPIAPWNYPFHNTVRNSSRHYLHLFLLLLSLLRQPEFLKNAQFTIFHHFCSSVATFETRVLY